MEYFKYILHKWTDAMFQPHNLDTQFDPDELGATALTAFFNITAGWGLAAEEERTLLGSPPRSTFFKWKSERAARLTPDTLERMLAGRVIDLADVRRYLDAERG